MDEAIESFNLKIVNRVTVFVVFLAWKSLGSQVPRKCDVMIAGTPSIMVYMGGNILSVVFPNFAVTGVHIEWLLMYVSLC